MAMLEMQTDMQRRNHFQGCYTAWDLNLDADGAVWPTDNVDGTVRNRHYCNGTLPHSSDLSMSCNKDLLKQTMLKHEAEFRNQIYELHRLYRRQKELMDDIKNSDSNMHHCSVPTFHPNHLLSSKSSNYVQMPHKTSASVNLVHYQSPVSEAKGSTLPLRSHDGNRGQAGPNPICIGSSSKASEFMESNCIRFSKKILDLELPADEYFDSEEEGSPEVKMALEVTDFPTNALKKNPEVRGGGDKELSFSGGGGCSSIFPEGNFISSSVASKKILMADLNIPVKLEEDIIPEYSDFLDPFIGQGETSLQDSFGKLSSSSQVLSKEIKRDPETNLETPVLDECKMQREHKPCNGNPGNDRNDLSSFPQDLYTEKVSVEHISKDQAQDCAIPHGMNETDGKLCNENLQHLRGVSSGNNKPAATSDKCSSYRAPLVDTINSESSCVSSRRRTLKRNPIAIQALPCFKGRSSKSFTVSSGLTESELCLSKNLSSSPKLSGATFSQASSQNDFQLESQLPSTSSVSPKCNNNNDKAFEHSPSKYTKDSNYVRSVKNLDLNLVMPSFSANVAGSLDASPIHGENTLQNSIGCSPSVAKTPVNATNSGEKRDPLIPLESALEQANSPCLRDAQLENMEARNSLDLKGIFGTHMYNKPPIANGQCSSHASPSRNHPNSFEKEEIKDTGKDRLPDINLEFDHVPDREKELAETESVAESEPCEKYPGYGVIDLHSCISMDESQPTPSHSIEIDLEPPASPENKECSPPRGDSDENQLEIPLLPSGQEDGDLQEALVRNAVEAIVSISSIKIHACLESNTCEPFKASNSLYWFARVASSVVDDQGSEYGVSIGVKDYSDHEDYLSDGIDYFEAMTLNLTEMKVEESWCKSNGQKEEVSGAVLLKNQTKRGRTRRGRQQRKDFQSEILPSLASLSRCEVNEDLQMIGGLMEAAGAQWGSGSSRTAGRNGYAKGRRRSNARVSNVMENTMNVLLKQQSGNSEMGMRQRRLIEWGKITRRPRGPRCPSTNPRLILGQV